MRIFIGRAAVLAREKFFHIAADVRGEVCVIADHQHFGKTFFAEFGGD